MFSLSSSNSSPLLLNSLSGVSILMSYGENPHYVKLPIFGEFMENSAKFMKNSGLKASTSESLPVSVAALRKPYTSLAHVSGARKE